jgi:TP901 family phage tail tape measure protein
MPDFAVNTAFTSQDRVTKSFGRMDKGANKFGKSASNAFKRASASAGKFEGITSGILKAGALQRGLGGLTRGLTAVSSEFVNFDQALTSASAKFKGLDLTTKAGQQTLLQLKKTARDVGAKTQFSATQAGEGLDFLAMAGFNANQAMAALPGVVDLATVANIDLARSTDIASDSLGAFGLMTEDATQLQKNFTRINDVMALTMSRTNTGIEDMFEAVKKGAPAFTAAGQSLESFNALLGVMANSGVKGSESGTALRNVMLSLSKPTDEAQAVLDRLGIKTKDADNNFRDVLDIIGDLEKGLKGVGTAQKTADLTTVFGKRTVTGVNILLKEGVDNLRKFRGELEGAAGSSKKMADVMRQSLLNRLKSLQSAAIETGFKFFTAFEKQGGSAIDTLTQAVRNFDIQPLINGVTRGIEIIKFLISVIRPLIPVIQGVIAGFVAYAALMKVLGIVQAIASFIQFLGVLKGMVGTMGILNAVMAANPVGAVIVAVSALIGVMVILEKKFKIFSKAFNKLKEFFGFGDVSLKAEVRNEETLRIEDERSEARREAPNAAEIEARQEIAFKGQLNIKGAPDGSTVESSTTGAPPIDVALLGEN